jgi:L-amino acid N-acyltransferase YncA
MLIRPATISDEAAMLSIYAPVVRETAISFEIEPPSLAEFEERVHKYSEGWEWLVAELDDKVLGYANGSPHRERPAYRWSTETSAYVSPAARRQGVGKRLYKDLLLALTSRGFCNAYAGISLPNTASVALHQSVGFRSIGTFPAVGRKFGKWHDVAWFHCALRHEPPGDGQH